MFPSFRRRRTWTMLVGLVAAFAPAASAAACGGR